MRVATYTRISPIKGRDDTLTQDRELGEFIKRNDWEHVAKYSDIWVSGSKSDRPQFKQMLEDASRKKFDVVLFWSLDRFSREGTSKTLHYLTMLESYGVGFRSYTEQYLDSCGIFKEAVIAIIAAIAKQERFRLIERTKAGLDTARARGKVLGRPKKVVDIVIAREMRDNGSSLKDIATRFEVSESKICRLLKAG